MGPAGLRWALAMLAMTGCRQILGIEDLRSGVSTSDGPVRIDSPIGFACGDGMVRNGVEECDPAATPEPECTSGCVSCPAGGVVSPSGHCYYYVAAAMTWTEAQASCAAEGGHLVTYADAAEADLVTPLRTTSVWIGADNAAQNDTYRWVEGFPLSYTNWQGSPSTTQPRCTEQGSSPQGPWIDQDCAATQASICEKDPHIYSGRKAYWALYELAAWQNSTNCGGVAHLVRIDDQGEDDLIDSLGPAPRWLGLHDRDVEGSFEWVVPVDPLGAFADWASGEPTGSAAENCVMVQDGQWYDFGCASLLQRVCEAD